MSAPLHSVCPGLAARRGSRRKCQRVRLTAGRSGRQIRPGSLLQWQPAASTLSHVYTTVTRTCVVTPPSNRPPPPFPPQTTPPHPSPTRTSRHTHTQVEYLGQLLMAVDRLQIAERWKNPHGHTTVSLPLVPTLQTRMTTSPGAHTEADTELETGNFSSRGATPEALANE